jgi:hypothetical protein
MGPKRTSVGSADQGLSRDTPAGRRANGPPVREAGCAGWNTRRPRAGTVGGTPGVDQPPGVVLVLRGELDQPRSRCCRAPGSRDAQPRGGGHRPGRAGVHRLKPPPKSCCERTDSCGPPTGTACSWADRAPCIGPLSSRAWIATASGATAQVHRARLNLTMNSKEG